MLAPPLLFIPRLVIVASVLLALCVCREFPSDLIFYSLPSPCPLHSSRSSLSRDSSCFEFALSLSRHTSSYFSLPVSLYFSYHLSLSSTFVLSLSISYSCLYFVALFHAFAPSLFRISAVYLHIFVYYYASYLYFVIFFVFRVPLFALYFRLLLRLFSIFCLYLVLFLVFRLSWLLFFVFRLSTSVLRISSVFTSLLRISSPNFVSASSRLRILSHSSFRALSPFLVLPRFIRFIHAVSFIPPGFSFTFSFSFSLPPRVLPLRGSFFLRLCRGSAEEYRATLPDHAASEEKTIVKVKRD